MVLFCWGFFGGEGWHYSLALLFFLKYIETFSKKKYLIFKTLQFGLNKRSAELSAGVYGKFWEKSHANSVVLFRSEAGGRCGKKGCPARAGADLQGGGGGGDRQAQEWHDLGGVPINP